MRVHKINNVNKALDFIASKGVKLVSIGAEGGSGDRGAAPRLGARRSRAAPAPSPAPPLFRGSSRAAPFRGASPAEKPREEADVFLRPRRSGPLGLKTAPRFLPVSLFLAV